VGRECGCVTLVCEMIMWMCDVCLWDDSVCDACLWDESVDVTLVCGMIMWMQF
jgi:hypothetical protein